MRKGFCCILGILLAAALAGITDAAAPGAASSTSIAATAPDTAPSDPRLADLIRRLGDPDPPRREAAQKELDETTWRDLKNLRAAADACTDAEAQARLIPRVQAIEEQIAADPPPISVHLQSAPLNLALQNLSENLGLSRPLVFQSNGQSPGPGLINIDATDQPFWEVFSKLLRDNDLSLTLNSQQMAVQYSASDSWKRGVIAGPVILVPQAITYSRTSHLQQNGPGLKSEVLRLTGVYAIDPRIVQIQTANPVFTDITDDAGNKLLSKPQAESLQSYSSWRPSTVLSFDCPLEIPQKIGTRIASAKGYVRFIAQTRQQTLEIADPKGKAGTDFPMGGLVFHLAKFDPQPGNQSVAFNISVTPKSPLAVFVQAGANPQNPQQINFAVINGLGQEAWSANVPANGGNGGSFGGVLTPPLKVRLTATTKTQDIKIPFELKDLPLP